MAIGACVLGNTLMGVVITMNGRIGATVRIMYVHAGMGIANFSKASHAFPDPSSYAFRILLQLLCCRLSLCTGHHLAWVSE